MRIRFLRDFQGVNTAERFYRAGEVADLPAGAAVVAEGAAEPAADEPEPDEPEPEQPATTTTATESDAETQPARPRGRKARP